MRVFSAWFLAFLAVSGACGQANLRPKDVRDIAWKAQTRLCARYRKMIARGKKPTVVVAAIARELAGFIWAIGHEMRITMAAG